MAGIMNTNAFTRVSNYESPRGVRALLLGMRSIYRKFSSTRIGLSSSQLLSLILKFGGTSVQTESINLDCHLIGDGEVVPLPLQLRRHRKLSW